MKFADQTGITELITLTKTALKPLETFKSSITDVNGIVKSNGSGGFSAAVAGTDYAAASHTHTTKQIEGLSSAIADAEPFVVEVTMTNPSNISANKTFSEIKAASDAKKLCYARITNTGMMVPLIGFDLRVDKRVAVFLTSNLLISSFQTVSLLIAEDNSVSTETFVSQPLIGATGLLKGSGDGAISAAVAGTDYLSPNGGTLTGPLVAQTNTSYTTAQMRNVIISTADPSGGNNGDIWLKYKA